MPNLKYRLLLMCCAATMLTGCGKLGYKTAVDVASPPSSAQISLHSKYYDIMIAVVENNTKNITALADASGKLAESVGKSTASKAAGEQQLRITGDSRNYDIVKPDSLSGYLEAKEKTEQVKLTAEAISKVADETKITVAVPDGLRLPAADPFGDEGKP